MTGVQTCALPIYFGATPPSVTVPNPSDPNNPLATLRLNPAELTFSCLTNSAAHTVSLTKLSDPADRDLQLFHVQRVPDQLAWQTDPAVGEIGQMILPSLQPGQSTTIGIQAARQTLDTERQAKVAEANARIAAKRAASDAALETARAAARGEVAAAVGSVTARAAQLVLGKAPDAGVVKKAVDSTMSGGRS